MYDYKLYVSLLIFVYSLMDSDERASLQKKHVSNEPSVKRVLWNFVQLLLLVMHVAFLKCCAFKKNQWNLFRVTFPFKHVVGGREAHKIVGVEL